MTISIHAPLAGCDCNVRDCLGAELISIHAPLAGCDYMSSKYYGSVAVFQSTHPLRGATTGCVWLNTRHQFQSTHPLRGATTVLPPALPPVSYFNPRTPCGVRLANGHAVGTDLEFQSTHPLRGATSGADSGAANCEFQSTHPLRGATHGHDVRRLLARYFNPRTPCGVRRQKTVTRWLDRDISIHAPLAGCDYTNLDVNLFYTPFQSTHPLRGATRLIVAELDSGDISIHAPLAGCDSAGC